VEPRNVVKEFWASYNRGNLDETWKIYVADDIVVHPSGGHELDHEGWLADEKALSAAFEAIDAKVLDQVAEGDMVASRWSFTGRQTAEFMGVSSPGRTATLTGMLFDRIRDGKIIEHWAEVGLAHFLELLSAH
jgi:predicted ester cyclase